MIKKATLSKDEKYRYLLVREWDSSLPMIAIVGLNPSTADDKEDDPTITRCINFAKAWGYGGIFMVNLFAFRATDPKELKSAQEPIGPKNDKYLNEIFEMVDKVICAWGNAGRLLNRSLEVIQLIDEPYCIRKNKSGEPAHPLYLKKDSKPILYTLSS